MLDRAFHFITLAVALQRVDRVVVGCPRREADQTDAKNRQCMILIQPDRGLRSLAQVSGIGAVVHNAEMFIRAPGIVACPLDDGPIAFR